METDGTGSNMAASQSARPSSLTYAWLYQRVQDYAAGSNRQASSKLERYAFWFGLGMAGVGLIAASLAPWISPRVAAVIALTCLIAEVAGLTVSMALTLKRELPQLRRPRESHATEMDLEYAKWQVLVAELRRFPIAEREMRLRFVTELRDNMGERMGLLFGGIQRLGIFPVLIALYLQFRDWEWGDWSGAFDVNLIGGLLIWFMLLMYAAGWLLVGLRTRLDTYVSLLESSLRD